MDAGPVFSWRAAALVNILATEEIFLKPLELIMIESNDWTCACNENSDSPGDVDDILYARAGHHDNMFDHVYSLHLARSASHLVS